ncbi:hypothetical protein BS47DRAFT_205357 [Hydnum rufescens UP504]|uniref:Zn(2)-C6 fungal-type domain-containing protein n=1 Tax=Hydnum rufescens UP504 TaxID=1448309 RepID=A0A9P6DNA3_9AGAM|nr:hypothetical protein BS47DRAFT_205357 [Hydnum rufescens UP504]
MKNSGIKEFYFKAEFPYDPYIYTCAPYSHHIFTVSNMTPGIPPQSDRSGCWLCRFRRKRCIPNPGGRCVDCFKFNMDCIGQGIDRPSGKELAEQVRAETKVWIKDRAKHDPSVPPLDLSYLWTPSLPSPASTPSATSPGPVTPNLDWDDTSIIINHSLFPVPETDSLLVQEIDITYPVSSNTLDEVPSSHGGITSPKMDWWAAKAACNVTTSIPPNHTQLPHHTQHPPPSTPIPAEGMSTSPFTAPICAHNLASSSLLGCS